MMADKYYDNIISKEMMLYYDKRAPEYDEVYFGKGPASDYQYEISKKVLHDVAKIRAMTRRFGEGHLVDIGCGTGFWLQYYAPNCRKITMLDQSARMLKQCEKMFHRVKECVNVRLVKGDFYKIDFHNRKFDSVFVGFFLSHVPLEYEPEFFKKVKDISSPDSRTMLIDSAWSPIRKKFRKKTGLHERSLNDGRKFTVYKRYFEKEEILKTLAKHGYDVESFYMGEAFFAAVVKKHGAANNRDCRRMIKP